ncbi:SUR7/PalI family-domain-containing protein [Thelonectria olida]|uniref:SUR7/PalI family-domain-containing protein n=1 Tax=Thelonectria olida TaxID=1576542 RepID=A0A9P8W2K0_9HYPO|nr:SUR7/PalI family-domain-containing protein [Thelonectria olida]
MLRPATPLAILLGAAFALLLLSVLSTPIIKAIPLGEFKGVTYGVFGYCQSGEGCTNIGIGYDAVNKYVGQPFEDDSSTFDLPSGVRNTLSAILVVHPVAALVTLVLFIMAVVTHMHAPSHSSRYLLIIFIFLFIDFLICLLAFLIDVLLFVPHLAWGSYIVLAATILVALSGLVTCAMRRTLISRKDRQKRIAENAEMSGENYYNRTAAQIKAEEPQRQPAIPAVSGANGGNNDSIPTFTSYEQNVKSDQISDENIPLTRRTTSNRSPVPPVEPGSVNEVFNNGPRRQGSRDQYGNPINEVVDGYGMRRGPSTERMRGRDMGPGGYRGGRGGGYGRGGFDNYGAPMRGRGGYGPPPGRGGYGPRGGRGGYGPPPRGGYGPRPMQTGPMQTGRSPPPGYPGAYDRRPSPAEAYVPYDNQPSEPSEGYHSYHPVSRVPSPLPGTQPATVGGQPIEMDAVPSEQRTEQGQSNYIRESDSDVAGMIGLQQGRLGPDRHDTYMTQSSKYSTDEQYQPPRAAWNQSGRSSPRAPSPLALNRPAELPVSTTPPGAPANNNNNSGTYYEDVDPQFAADTPPNNGNLQPPPIEPIYEDIHANNPGARSPAESERSNFTSISQRGVNPRWNPNAPPMPYQQGPPARRPLNQQQQRQDMLLDNPDFQLPGSRSKGGPGMVPGSAYPTGRM